MRPQTNVSLMKGQKRWVKWILAGGGLGFSPFAPGTVGSLAALPMLVYSAQVNSPVEVKLICYGLVFCLSWWLLWIYEKDIQEHDAAWVVLDEILGLSLCAVLTPPHNLMEVIALFCLFRFFDITKPWPANFFDRQKNSLSVFLDDLVAGFYASLVFFIAKNYLL